MKRFPALALSVAALVLPLIARAVVLAAEPPFTTGLPERRPPRLALRGIEFAHPVPGGEVRIRADAADPGYAGAGPFQLGLPTFLALSRVRAELREGEGTKWQVTAGTGSLRPGRLDLAGRPAVDGHPAGARASIDLKTGELETR